MLKATAQADGTRTALLDAAFETLRQDGYAKASARLIANRAGVNQALVFYHFGGVSELFVAALERSSQARLARYRNRLDSIRDPVRLFQRARTLHREDVESGHTTVLTEMGAAAMADERIRTAMAAGVGAWLEFVESTLARVLGATPVAGLLPVAALARAVLALQLGADLLARLEPSADWINKSFSAAERLAALVVADA